MPRKKKVEAVKPPHSKFGPSKAHRWLYCHASIRDEAKFPSTTSKYAEEGTCAHRLAELCLNDAVAKRRKKPSWYLGKKCDETGLVYNQEMIDNVKIYLSIIFSIYNPHEDKIMVEGKLSAPELSEDYYGTIDCLIEKPAKLVSVDFKYGKGIAVHAVENEQMLCYNNLATYCVGKKKKFEQHIVQPRLDDPAMRHTKWEYGAKEMKAHEKLVKAAMKGAASKNPAYAPGEKRCHFCKAQATCQALQAYTMEVMSQDFTVIDSDSEFTPTVPDELSGDQIAFVLRNKKLIETWLASVQAYAIDSLEKDSRAIPEYKVVRGRSNRRWSCDEKKIVKAVLKARKDLDKEDLYKSSLITVAQLEKLMGKNEETDKILGKLWDKPPGKLTLVPVEDGRKGISSLDDYE